MFYPIPYFCPAVSVLSAVAVFTFLYMIWRHYRVDRPFPPGCCTGCGWRFEEGDGHDCPRCGRTRRCRVCGYDLTGNRSGVCPECGSAVL